MLPLHEEAGFFNESSVICPKLPQASTPRQPLHQLLDVVAADRLAEARLRPKANVVESEKVGLLQGRHDFLELLYVRVSVGGGGGTWRGVPLALRRPLQTCGAPCCVRKGKRHFHVLRRNSLRRGAAGGGCKVHFAWEDRAVPRKGRRRFGRHGESCVRGCRPPCNFREGVSHSRTSWGPECHAGVMQRCLRDGLKHIGVGTVDGCCCLALLLYVGGCVALASEDVNPKVVGVGGDGGSSGPSLGAASDKGREGWGVEERDTHVPRGG